MAVVLLAGWLRRRDNERGGAEREGGDGGLHDDGFGWHFKVSCLLDVGNWGDGSPGCRSGRGEVEHYVEPCLSIGEKEFLLFAIFGSLTSSYIPLPVPHYSWEFVFVIPLQVEVGPSGDP